VPETVVVIPTDNERDNVAGLLPEVLTATDCHVVVDVPSGVHERQARRQFACAGGRTC
jgi:hypothetical protein